MKNKFAFGFATAIIILVGCRGPNDVDTRARNTESAYQPEFVANTPKGKLFRIWLDMGSSMQADRVYYFENDTNTITLNKTSGKNHHVEAIVVIDGIEYIKK